jgi:hypothetical protein
MKTISECMEIKEKEAGKPEDVALEFIPILRVGNF